MSVSQDHEPTITAVTSGYTPGPWTIDGRNRTNDGWCLYGKDGYGIGVAWDCNGNPENEANAHLIAAAPTMADFVAKKAAEGDAEAVRIMEVIHGHA